AQQLSKLAYIESSIGSKEAARRAYEQVRDSSARLLAEKPSDRAALAFLAGTNLSLAEVLHSLGKSEGSAAAGRTARDLYAELAAGGPGARGYSARQARALYFMAHPLMALGRYDDAKRAYEESVGRLKQLADRFPDVPDYHRGLALIYDA